MKRLIPIIKFLLVAIILFFVFRYLIRNWDQFSSLNIRLNYYYVILSFVVMHMAWMTSAWAWGETLQAFGYKLSYRDLYTIYFRSMPAKYLPGKVWQISGMTYLCAKYGVPEGAAIGSGVLGQAYSVMSGFALVACAFAFDIIRKPGEGFTIFRWSSIPILAVLLVLVIKPDLSERLMNWALRFLRRQQVNMVVTISTSLRLFLIYLIPWFLFGMAFWLLSHALTPLPFSFYLPLTAILAASTIIGFLTIFAPGGIGVKEASIAAMMASLTAFPAPNDAAKATFALAVGFGYRIVTSVVELMAFGITWLITLRQKRD